MITDTRLSPRLVTPPLRVAQGAAIASVGVSVPDQVVPNHAIAERLGLAPGWIERRTGIHERRIADRTERLTTHAARAGERALQRAGVAAAELDLVVVATTTADEILPNAAPLVAHALGARRAGAFDVGAACTGFLSALSVGATQIESGRAHRVLVVGADLMSRITDPDNVSTAAVFADGAGAVVLVDTAGDGRIGTIQLGADGEGAPYIRVPRETGTIEMQGHETFRHAVATLTLATLQVTRAAGVSLHDIDLFVYHQANGRILSAVAERLGLAPERVVDCIGQYGNTSAATLPLALGYSEREGRLHAGDRVLLGAFGAGFTWGAAVVDWGVPTP